MEGHSFKELRLYNFCTEKVLNEQSNISLFLFLSKAVQQQYDIFQLFLPLNQAPPAGKSPHNKQELVPCCFLNCTVNINGL